MDATLPTTTLTSSEFDRDTDGARKAAQRGAVFVTDRGRPAYVLLTIDEYRRLTGGSMSVAEALAQPGGPDFDFEAPRLSDGIFRPVDLG